MAVCDGHAIKEQDPGFEQLRKLYSCFRPVVMEENRRARLRYGWSSQTLAGSSQLRIAAEDVADEAAHQEVYLDEGERFSQLCTVTNVVTQGSRPGLFTRHINISDGVIRVFRDWLASMLERPSHLQSGASSSAAAPSPAAVRGTTLASSGVFSSDDSRVLWVDSTRDVGLRFRVMPGPEARGTIFEDEPPVFYNLIYEGWWRRNHFISRPTTTLLMAVEEAAVKHVSHSGKDIIIAAM
ncbi:hypothetical protein J3F83DRAFT_731618 [Trichoderma novae-zelandiae]